MAGDTALRLLQIALEDGFTNGPNSVYNGGTALAATRQLAPSKGIGADWDPTWERPEDARGDYAGSYTSLLHQLAAKGKIPSAVYVNDLVYLLRMCVSGAPIVTTLPTTPIVLLAQTAIAATMSLTTQPNNASDVTTPGSAVGKVLAVTLSNATSDPTSVTVTVAGTDVFSNPLTETITFGNGTRTNPRFPTGAAVAGQLTSTQYTKAYFRTVTAAGITTNAQPVGDQIAVGGVNGFLWQFKPDMKTSTIMSATGEYFDGSAAWQLPGMVLSKAKLAAEIGKSMKFDGDFMAKAKQALTAAVGSINPTAQTGHHDALTNLATSVAAAIATYQSNFYADPIGTAPGTTNVPARLTGMSLDLDTAIKQGKAADGTPAPTYISRDYYGPKTKVEFTLLFNSMLNGISDPVELAQFLAYNSRTIRGAFPGGPMPCGILNAASNWPTALQVGSMGGSYGLMIDVAGKYEKPEEVEVEGKQAFKFAMLPEVDVANMGVMYQLWCVSGVNPYRY